MIPAIIVMLMRRYQRHYPQQFLILKAKLFYTARIVLMMLIVCLLALITQGQEKNLNYDIRKNGSSIGNMLVKEIKEGKTIRLKSESNIKTGFIFTITAKGIEEARYDSGVLMYSSVYQKLNGNEKVNKQIRYANNIYVVSNKGKEERLGNVKIGYNLVCIYNHEPVHVSLIFSDKYQKLLPVQKIEEHHYRIRFPDGSANDYWFENGVCKKIEIDHTFYSAVMELSH
jgi:hypothetical protein